MLFSIPESGWWLIALAATAFFMLGVRALVDSMRLPGASRSAWKQQSRWKRRAFYVLTPVFAAVVLAINLLRSEPVPELLFLYSVAFVSLPIALFPVRARVLRHYIAQRQNSGVEIEPDRLTVVWIVGFLSAVLLTAVLALLTTRYDM
ncbi:hypothetical protein F0L17_26550 [Streptomyces sp. TRM43335]|uniref:Uncharacterized protein n=1 Tax=Streptomyces taklimakanensis TaxID=2569853 RepID=A0A6G2BJY0_9ACTN|nr:hypothetical protein [Streptomyces taklimakanensis]MTE22591.1 hypothetical protein [Streptomyces taklimakanensis]